MARVGEWQELKLQRQRPGFMESVEFGLDLEGGGKPFKDLVREQQEDLFVISFSFPMKL